MGELFKMANNKSSISFGLQFSFSKIESDLGCDQDQVICIKEQLMNPIHTLSLSIFFLKDTHFLKTAKIL